MKGGEPKGGSNGLQTGQCITRPSTIMHGRRELLPCMAGRRFAGTGLARWKA